MAPSSPRNPSREGEPLEPVAERRHAVAMHVSASSALHRRIPEEQDDADDDGGEG